MKIALDYDKTYNQDRSFWNSFIKLAKIGGHDIRIVTARSPIKDKLSTKQLTISIPVIYCDGVAKRFHCSMAVDWEPDIWIDDKPENVDKNSTASKQVLETWRNSLEYYE